jgi:hypothetical protein
MPGQDVIDMNSNTLKGYGVQILDGRTTVDSERIKNFTRFTNETEDKVFNTRNFVGEVYLKYVIDEAKKMGGNLESNMAAIQRQINNGNEEYVNGARDRIAAALGIQKEVASKENKEGISLDEGDSLSGGDVPLPEGKMKVQYKDGQTKIVDDNKENRNLIDGENFILIDENKKIKQDEKIIDESKTDTTTQFLKSEAIKKERIRPGGDAGQGEFQSLSEIKAILQRPMSGKEIKETYAIAFPVNDKTIYRPSR